MTIVYVDNSNAILLEGLHSEVDGSYINDAAVTVVIKDADGEEVAGGSKALDYIAASNGNYRAVLADTIAFEAFAPYTAEVTANGGTDRVGRWVFSFTPISRIS